MIFTEKCQKRIMRIKYGYLIAAILLIVAVSCQKEAGNSVDNGQMTQLKVNLTDNPFNASEVNVDIREVKVNFRNDSTGWISLNTNTGIYNLLGLQNGVDTLLAVGPVPLDTLKEIRFVLGSNNSIKIDTTLYPLTIPSGGESGLKIKVNKKLNATIDSLLIDFDAALSIMQTGNGDYKLKPVLKIK